MRGEPGYWFQARPGHQSHCSGGSRCSPMAPTRVASSSDRRGRELSPLRQTDMATGITPIPKLLFLASPSWNDASPRPHTHTHTHTSHQRPVQTPQLRDLDCLLPHTLWAAVAFLNALPTNAALMPSARPSFDACPPRLTSPRAKQPAVGQHDYHPPAAARPLVTWITPPWGPWRHLEEGFQANGPRDGGTTTRWIPPQTFVLQ